MICFFFPAEQLTCKESDFDVNMYRPKEGTSLFKWSSFFPDEQLTYIASDLDVNMDRSMEGTSPVQLNWFFQSAFLYIASDFDFKNETLQKDCELCSSSQTFRGSSLVYRPCWLWLTKITKLLLTCWVPPGPVQVIGWEGEDLHINKFMGVCHVFNKNKKEGEITHFFPGEDVVISHGVDGVILLKSRA